MKRILPVIAAALALSAFAASAPAQQAATPAAKNAATGNTAFAADLYAQLLKTNADKNLFMSPYSISAALGMTAQGAKANTAAQMEKVLHSGPNFQTGMADITKALAPNGAPFELSVSNALWVDKTFPLLPAFVEGSQKNYNAPVLGVDFINATEAARKTINDAVATQTHDKIKDLIPGGAVTKATRLVLTDAIYFKGTWQTQFDKKLTTDQPFHALGGKNVTVPLMKAPDETRFAYADTPDAQIIALPYKGAPVPNARAGRGTPQAGPSTLSMLILLPKKADGLADLEKQATPENLAKWSTGLRTQPVEVFLPRFTLTSEFELSSQLQTLGMTDAFSDSADFSGISNAGKLFISKVLHKAFVDVNEEGTEAAAATAVVMNLAMAPAQNPPVFRADHPFLFMIRHDPTNSILFMGHLNNPKP